jgi:hypothetical protein
MRIRDTPEGAVGEVHVHLRAKRVLIAGRDSAAIFIAIELGLTVSEPPAS